MKTRILSLFCLVGTVPAAGAPPAAAAGLSDPLGAPVGEAADYRLGTEDLIEISVFQIPQLNRTVRVSEQGAISLPLVGEVEVEDLTPRQLETRLRELLSERYVRDPQVSVFVREHGSKKVSVLGAVSKPGVYEMLGPRTLLEVLSQAGGLTGETGTELFVIRTLPDGRSDRISVDIEGLLAYRDSRLNLTLEPGDVVSVSVDRKMYLYVDGAVRSPGRLVEWASRPLTLMQAVAAAGGVTERADLKGIQILRGEEDGNQTEIYVNLKRIRRGTEPDPLLQDGDIVVVPETFF